MKEKIKHEYTDENPIRNYDPIFDYIGKIVQVCHSGRKYHAKLIAINGDEVWLESRDKQRWMVSRKILEYIGLVGTGRVKHQPGAV